MKQTILNGVLALALAAPGLMAQLKPKSQGELDALKAMFTATTARRMSSARMSPSAGATWWRAPCGRCSTR